MRCGRKGGLWWFSIGIGDHCVVRWVRDHLLRWRVAFLISCEQLRVVIFTARLPYWHWVGRRAFLRIEMIGRGFCIFVVKDRTVHLLVKHRGLLLLWNLHAGVVFVLHRLHDFLWQGMHTFFLLAVILFISWSFMHLLIKFVFIGTNRATSIHALDHIFYFLLTQVKIFTIFEWLVSTIASLELNHLVDFRLLLMLDVVELLPNLVLPMLAPRDEIVKDRFREVMFLNLLLLLAQLIAQLRLLI